VSSAGHPPAAVVVRRQGTHVKRVPEVRASLLRRKGISPHDTRDVAARAPTDLPIFPALSLMAGFYRFKYIYFYCLFTDSYNSLLI
jgi:hypothetical protein